MIFTSIQITDQSQLNNVVKEKQRKQIGLVNQGATCYMNSVFQALCHNNVFKLMLKSIDIDKEQIQQLLDKYIQTGTQNTDVQCDFVKTIVILMILKLEYRFTVFDPIILLKQMGFTTQQLHMQDDADGFMSQILDKFEDVFKQQNKLELYKQLVQNHNQYVSQCQNCDYQSKTDDLFFQQHLPLKSNLFASFAQLLQREYIEDYTCSQCKQKVTVQRFIELKTPQSQFYGVKINRFQYNMYGECEKMCESMVMPVFIDLGIMNQINQILKYNEYNLGEQQQIIQYLLQPWLLVQLLHQQNNIQQQETQQENNEEQQEEINEKLQYQIEKQPNEENNESDTKQEMSLYSQVDLEKIQNLLLNNTEVMNYALKYYTGEVVPIENSQQNYIENNYYESPLVIEENINSCNLWRLSSVVNHVGSFYGGHYYTYLLQYENNGQLKELIEVNDEGITTKSNIINTLEKAACNKNQQNSQFGDTGYIYLYEKAFLEQVDNQSLLEHLEDETIKQQIRKLEEKEIERISQITVDVLCNVHKVSGKEQFLSTFPQYNQVFNNFYSQQTFEFDKRKTFAQFKKQYEKQAQKFLKCNSNLLPIDKYKIYLVSSPSFTLDSLAKRQRLIKDVNDPEDVSMFESLEYYDRACLFIEYINDTFEQYDPQKTYIKVRQIFSDGKMQTQGQLSFLPISQYYIDMANTIYSQNISIENKVAVIKCSIASNLLKQEQKENNIQTLTEYCQRIQLYNYNVDQYEPVNIREESDETEIFVNDAQCYCYTYNMIYYEILDKQIDSNILGLKAGVQSGNNLQQASQIYNSIYQSKMTYKIFIYNQENELVDQFEDNCNQSFLNIYNRIMNKLENNKYKDIRMYLLCSMTISDVHNNIKLVEISNQQYEEQLNKSLLNFTAWARTQLKGQQKIQNKQLDIQIEFGQTQNINLIRLGIANQKQQFGYTQFLPVYTQYNKTTTVDQAFQQLMQSPRLQYSYQYHVIKELKEKQMFVIYLYSINDLKDSALANNIGVLSRNMQQKSIPYLQQQQFQCQDINQKIVERYNNKIQQYYIVIEFANIVFNSIKQQQINLTFIYYTNARQNQYQKIIISAQYNQQLQQVLQYLQEQCNIQIQQVSLVQYETTQTTIISYQDVYRQIKDFIRHSNLFIIQ